MRNRSSYPGNKEDETTAEGRRNPKKIELIQRQHPAVSANNTISLSELKYAH